MEELPKPSAYAKRCQNQDFKITNWPGRRGIRAKIVKVENLIQKVNLTGRLANKACLNMGIIEEMKAFYEELATMKIKVKAAEFRQNSKTVPAKYRQDSGKLPARK